MDFSILISAEYTCMVKNCHDMNDPATKMTLKKKKKEENNQIMFFS